MIDSPCLAQMTNVKQEYKEALGDSFELITAFSRQGPKKVYVQHRLKERAKEVNELLSQKAFFYVCGDAANMAREVTAVLAQIIAEGRGVSEAKGEEIVKSMRSANQYQVRALGRAGPTPEKRLLMNQTGGRLVLDGGSR